MVAFRSAESAIVTVSSGTTITVNRPAGVVDGDLLIAQGRFRGLPPNLPTGSGWQRLDSFLISNGNHAIWWKIADSEPASYDFVQTSDFVQPSSVGWMAAGISAWSNPNPDIPMEVFQRAAGDSAPSALSMTGGLVLRLWGWSTGNTPTIPAGPTQIYRESVSGGGPNSVLAGYESMSAGLIGALATTGTSASTPSAYSIVLPNSVSPDFAFIRGYRWENLTENVTGTTITVPAPIHQDGDTLIAQFRCRGSLSTGPGDGWTLLTTEAQSFGSHSVWWKVASSEPSSYTFTQSSTNAYMAAAVFSVGRTAGIDVWDSSQGDADAPTVTTTVDDALVVRLWGWIDSDAPTVPDTAGMRYRSGIHTGGRQSLIGAVQHQATAGPTGTIARTAGGTVPSAFTIAFEPNPLPPPTPPGGGNRIGGTGAIRRSPVGR